MSRTSILWAAALAATLLGVAAIAQAEQPGSQEPWFDHMADHHQAVVDVGWWDEMTDMMEQAHGVDAADLERHWDEMSEWMDDRNVPDAEGMDEMMEDLHGTGFGPGMHGTSDGWSEGHCGGGPRLDA